MEVRRSAERATTRWDRIVSRHSFSFGPHYDPGNLGFGVLVAHNEDTIGPGAGYGLHPHRDMEIVTWVLDGALEHRDSAGHAGVVVPGILQLMSAGRGVQHVERSADTRSADTRSADTRSADTRSADTRSADARSAADERQPLRMVQMWVSPDVLGTAPSYAQTDLESALRAGELVPAASGLARHRPDALPLAQAAAAMHVARLPAGSSVVLPDAPLAHLFVARGTVRIETDGAALAVSAGDAVRVRRSQGERLTADDAAEIVLWELHPPA
jgi:redox-sensitive bicupin YhaK (pirin superfamily)